MKYFLKNTFIIVVIFFITITTAIPVNALTDFQSDSEIELYDPLACTASQDATSTDVNLTGGDNAEKVWNYFIDKGITPEQTAGIMGNMSQESHFDPQIAQTGGRVKDPSVFGSAVGVGKAWGLIQWDAGGRAIGYAKSAKITTPIYELKTQLDIIWWHMNNSSPTGASNILPKFKETKNPKDAATAWEHLMEGAGTPMMDNRWAAAKAAFRQFSGSTPSGASSVQSDVSACACQESASKAAAVTSDQLKTRLEELGQKNGGKTTIAVSTVDGTAKADYSGTDQMPTRSAYKAYTAYATLRAIDEGRIDWSTTIWDGKSVKDTMEAMIVKSNNDAATALRTNSTIGKPSKVTDMLHDDVGLSDKTIIGTGGADNSNSKSTAKDYVKFLVQLENDKLPGVTQQSSYDTLIGFMSRATTDGNSARDGIAAGTGGVQVADKPGWASGSVDPASNDVGIVYYNDRPYVIAILTDTPNKWDGVAKISEGVYQAISGLKGGSTNSCGGAVSGDFASTVKNYAWPDHHDAPYLNRKPAWAKVADDPKSHYVGGTVGGVKGIDCGGFVTMTIRDSGIDPDYNPDKGNTTGGQIPYLTSKWKKLSVSTTSDLQPGDVAISDQHTFLYVGKINGFNDEFASASYSTSGNGRAPMAGQGDAMSGKYSWYRSK